MEYPPAAIARALRKKYYVARHADWLLIMDKGCNKYLATIYVYPRAKEVVVVDRANVYLDVLNVIKELDLDFKVTKRAPETLRF